MLSKLKILFSDQKLLARAVLNIQSPMHYLKIEVPIITCFRKMALPSDKFSSANFWSELSLSDSAYFSHINGVTN